ncbi:MAG TPA: hypothetical protein VF541_11065, partial [Longimicrobium sp.]
VIVGFHEVWTGIPAVLTFIGWGQPTIQASVKAGTVTIAGKASLDLSAGTLNSILKQARLK